MADISTSKTPAYESSLEPGDRFEASAANAQLLVPEALSALGASIDVLEDEQGHSLPLTRDAAGRVVKLPDSVRPLLEQAPALWLEYRAPGRFRLLAEPSSADGKTLTTEHGLSV